VARITERIVTGDFAYVEIEAEHAAEWKALRAEVLVELDGPFRGPFDGTGATESDSEVVLGVEAVAEALGAEIGPEEPLSADGKRAVFLAKAKGGQ